MSSPDTTIAVKEHLLQDSESSDRKPQLAAGGDEIQGDGQSEASEPQKLQRYWLRTLVLILIPAIVTVWYGVIWIALVLGIRNDDVVKYRTYSGSLIFYSWFIIGVFALSWAKFGLAGVEIAMLQTPFWRAPNLIAFLMHSNTTWSSPSGWLSAIYHREFHRLWCLLTFLSVLPFIAFPLSGLVFEISDGWIQTGDHPYVMGRNDSTFDQHYPLAFGTPAESAWQNGMAPIVPGFGLVYTPENLDRTKHSSLKRVPNSLPLDEPIPEMFLPPQADVPLSGKAWGLRVKYDCSTVRDASEFTILNQKHESAIEKYKNQTSKSPFVTLKTPSGDSIDIYNTGVVPQDNIWAYTEMGYNPQKFTRKWYEPHPDFSPDDVSNSIVLEYAVWQFEFKDFYDDQRNQSSWFNTTVGPGIEGMDSPFLLSDKNLTVNEAFYKVRAGGNFTEYPIDDDGSGGTPQTHTEKLTDLRDIFDTDALTDYPFDAMDAAAPIGVRCIVSSSVGNANLDGVTTTFSNFERFDPNNEEMKELSAGHHIFGYTAFQALSRKFGELYQAGHLPPEVPQESEHRFTSYINAPALRKAVMLAYGLEALQLMYDINPAPERAWVHPGLRSARQGKVLGIASLIPGSGLGYFVLALLCLWSVASAALGIIYGFRKRPSDKLDGESVFRRGVRLAEDVKHNSEFQSGKKTFYANKKFQTLPGS